MADLAKLVAKLDPKKRTCRAIIETPTGCRNKFDYDPDSGLFIGPVLTVKAAVLADACLANQIE